MNKEEQENMFKMFLNFLSSYDYNIEISEEIKEQLFTKDYYSWLSVYQDIIVDYNTYDDEDWKEAVNNIKYFNIY